MDLVYVSDHRFSRLPDRSVWSWYFGHDFFASRYLGVFDRVIVLARGMERAEVPASWKRSDAPAITFPERLYYHGPLQFALQRHRVHRMAARYAELPDAAFLLRGGQISVALAAELLRRGMPYGAEIVGDVEQFLKSGAIRDPLGGLSCAIVTRQIKRLCRQATAVQYVTNRTLQERYPCPGLMAGIANVDLPKEAFVAHRRRFRAGRQKWGLVTIGSLDSMVKGPDVLLRAVRLCLNSGVPLTLTYIGGGEHLGSIQALAARLGLSEAVTFRGCITDKNDIRRCLDEADLFVLPSRSEGLPRSLLEAMARGLPCIATHVGGIPELLEPDDTVAPNDAQALAGRIVDVLAHPDRLSRMAARNLARSREYSAEILRARRTEFLKRLRDCTIEAADAASNP